jgi:hypothetical protein
VSAFPAAFSVFFVVIAVVWLVAIAGVVLGISALISVAGTPTEAFGPWWDNTRQVWLIGIAVGFVLPFGTLVAGYLWFANGRAPLRAGQGFAGRPFWAGPPKPPPGWPGYPPPGYGPPPAAPPSF